VALSLGSPPLDVIQHPALWSPDFPPLAVGQERSSDPLRPVIFILRGGNPPLESPRQTGGGLRTAIDPAKLAGQLAWRMRALARTSTRAQHLGRPKQHEAAMWTGECLGLQTNFGDHLRWHLEMTPTTDTIL
jgi:hypothetical protein